MSLVELGVGNNAAVNDIFIVTKCVGVTAAQP